MKPPPFIKKFEIAALQAGCIARRFQGETRTMQKTGKETPEGAALTLADLTAQDVILIALKKEFSQCSLDAEEDTLTRTHFASEGTNTPLMVIDPIDGTLNYSQGSEDYAVMGGWVEKNIFTQALVHYPAFGETFRAWKGAGAWHVKEGGKKVCPLKPDPDNKEILLTPRAPESLSDALKSEGFKVTISRCSASDGVSPARGKVAASISFGPLTRTRACALLIAKEAGATVITGKEPWTGEDPEKRAKELWPVVTAASRELGELLVGIAGKCR
jgi:fructose-1,6-bisphosphatase/inositol monophosphatase family enzyme